MSKPLRILHLEDNSVDALLIQRQLTKAGIECEFHKVEKRADYERALGDSTFDLIISDFSLPDFDGMSALEMAHAKYPNLPFIFVSGTLGEETAIEALKHGATDYVLKQRMMRLVPAVERAIKEVEERAERRRAEDALRFSEEQLRQAQKMEAIGKLAGGIAHDFNNLLTVIIGQSELLLSYLKEEEKLRTKVSEIKRAGERAAALTKQLLAFSRRQMFQLKEVNLNDVVSEMERMLGRLIGEDIELQSVLDEKCGKVKADPGQIEQVIMNLAVNARDAMPDGGKIVIETRDLVLDEMYARQQPETKPGRYVMLAVSDTGTGMDIETQKRIFEPFFTTKEMGKGTGLGLSTVYGIVQQSGGHITVYSEIGRGTTFRVYLPCIDEEGAKAYDDMPHITETTGTETILLVEDEEMVRQLTREMLELKGYTVLESENVRDAQMICKLHRGPIHLLLTDVVMPEMSGRELPECLLKIRPDMRVLYMSGYTDQAIVHHGILDEGISFIEKPFTSKGLARKVREVLGPKI